MLHSRKNRNHVYIKREYTGNNFSINTSHGRSKYARSQTQEGGIKAVLNFSVCYFSSSQKYLHTPWFNVWFIYRCMNSIFTDEWGRHVWCTKLMYNSLKNRELKITCDDGLRTNLTSGSFILWGPRASSYPVYRLLQLEFESQPNEVGNGLCSSSKFVSHSLTVRDLV